MAVTAEELVEIGRANGLVAVGVARAAPFEETRVALEDRRDRGLHADMAFTYRNPARSTDPARTLPGARSLVVGAFDYQRERPDKPAGGAVARVASYAWEDHYAALRSALEPVAEHLRRRGHRAVVLADQNHLVDRAAAHRAGIGWWGRSSNVLVPGVGSMVVLGSVLTDAPLVADAVPVADGCGTCRRCIDGCPTGAITEAGEVDARRCLAWLVQAEGVFPAEYREALGDRLYGCDECQDVCPPNIGRKRRPSAAGDDGAWVDVVELLGRTDDDLLDRYGRWYIPRRDPQYLRRNALLVLGNTGDRDDPRVIAALRASFRSDSAIVRAHAVWAARRLGRPDLVEPLTHDPDPLVRAELS